MDTKARRQASEYSSYQDLFDDLDKAISDIVTGYFNLANDFKRARILPPELVNHGQFVLRSHHTDASNFVADCRKKTMNSAYTATDAESIIREFDIKLATCKRLFDKDITHPIEQLKEAYFVQWNSIGDYLKNNEPNEEGF
jgi:hypothetical protein